MLGFLISHGTMLGAEHTIYDFTYLRTDTLISLSFLGGGGGPPPQTLKHHILFLTTHSNTTYYLPFILNLRHPQFFHSYFTNSNQKKWLSFSQFHKNSTKKKKKKKH
jgi:hypothetical protein